MMIKKGVFTFFAASLMLLVGCFSFNFGFPTVENDNIQTNDAETVLIANTNNVYRLATNTILRVKTQQNKNGKWIECEHRVLIPENWFIVSGDGLD